MHLTNSSEGCSGQTERAGHWLTSFFDVAVGARHANDTVGAVDVSPSCLYASVFADQVVTYIALLHVFHLATPTTIGTFHGASTASSSHAVQQALTARSH